MAAHVSHKKLYIAVFIALAVLTAIELVIPEMDMTQFVKGVWLTVVAIIKAGLVGWYFMHLNEERAWLKFIALIPCAAFIYAYVVIIESLYR